MKLIELINERQSVRKYSSKPVERELLLECVEAIRMAPSANNSQPWKIIIVDLPEVKEKLAEAVSVEKLINKFASQAAAFVVIVLEKTKIIERFAMRLKKKDWDLIDIGIAAENFCLQATELGLGTCMIGWFDEKKVKKCLNIPDKKTVGLIISVGYAEDGYKQRPKVRKTLEEILSYNQY